MMRMIWRAFLGLLLTIFLLSCSQNNSSLGNITDQPSFEDLRNGFLSPPHSAKPLTWFHAMSGNMSKEGISKDLEAIADAGIGGTILFNVTQGIPIGPIKFNSDEHIEIIRHMAAESERLGLSFGVHNADGWTSSGGPWITPELSMKKVVWSEVQTQGGDVAIVVPKPRHLHDYYEDIAVLAYPSLPSEEVLLRPKITASDPNLSIDLLSDGDAEEVGTVAISDDGTAWVEFDYGELVTIRSVDALLGTSRRMKFELQYFDTQSSDFVTVKRLAIRRPGKAVWALDEAVPETTAQRFRIVATGNDILVREMALSPLAKMNNYMGQTSLARTTAKDLPTIGQAAPENVINPAEIINLTDSLSPQDALNTTLPSGAWTILRIGYTTTGAINIPASKEGTGLENDKFSREAFKVHYEAYVGRVRDAIKDVAPNAHQYVEIDSYEVGGQNWTQGYEEIFAQKFGYDLTPYLPLFTGRFVGSPDISQAVLYDTRTLFNELIQDNYYAYFTELANADGIETYIEPYGFGPFNSVDAGGHADRPMGEFWSQRDKTVVSAAASAAHIYDKNIVAAEAFTAFPEINWNMHPAMIKGEGDRHFALGINQMVFHRFAHQANTHVKPGMTMNRWGNHFDRTNTWWDTAGKAYFNYLSRVQYLLQQGDPVMEALIFVGDNAPTTCPEKHQFDAFPAAINFDCVSAEILNGALAGEGGLMTLSHGATYSILYLPNVGSVTNQTLSTLEGLAAQGVLIVGERPSHLSGGGLNETDPSQFQNRITALWAKENVYDAAKVAVDDWQGLLAKQGRVFDADIISHPDWIYTHRRIGDKNIYFLYNPTDEAQFVDASFRVQAAHAEIWSALDQSMKLLKMRDVGSSQKAVSFTLGPHDSAFIVFHNDDPAKEKYREAIIAEATQIETVWSVSFDPEYGLSDTIKFDTLLDWKDHPRQEIRSYSGPATYMASFDFDGDLVGETYLDLGDVNVAAEVTLNGKNIGTVWKAPYILDATDAIKSGENEIEIKVVNLWVNRLIADQALPDLDNFTPASWVPTTYMPEWYYKNEPPTLGERVTFTTADFYKADDPLVSSGLLGPVQILEVED